MSLTSDEIRGLFQTIETAINHFHAYPAQILPKIEELKGMALRTSGAETQAATSLLASKDEQIVKLAAEIAALKSDNALLCSQMLKWNRDSQKETASLKSERDRYREALKEIRVAYFCYGGAFTIGKTSLTLDEFIGKALTTPPSAGQASGEREL